MSTVIKEPPAAPGTPPANPTPEPPVDPKPPETTPETPPAVPPAEVSYDVKLGKDSPLDAKADVDKVVTFAKAHKLSNEQAQALMKDVVEDVGVRMVVRENQKHEATRARFLEEAKADPTIGGAKFDDTIRDVERALNWLSVYLPDDVKRFREEIGQTPYGNYPPYLKMFARIGKAVAPDQTPINPGPPGGGNSPKELKELLYPKKTG